MPKDKHLQSVKLQDVLDKRRLGQPVNAKEFAVLTAISYSRAREWFRLPGFPALRGVVFWEDFVRWRNAQSSAEKVAQAQPANSFANGALPPRSAQILLE